MVEVITSERLAELKARAEAATQGEWRRVAQGGSSTVLTATQPARNDIRIPTYGYRDDGEHCLAYPFIGDGNVVGDVRLDFVCFSHEDAAHIVASQPAEVLSLIAALEAAWAERDETPSARRAFCAGYRCAGEDANRAMPIGWERYWTEHQDVLSVEASTAFVTALSDPPEPNDALKLAAANYRANAAETLSTRLQAELAEAREGLSPFAKAWKWREEQPHNRSHVYRAQVGDADFRRARAIIEKGAQ